MMILVVLFRAVTALLYNRITKQSHVHEKQWTRLFIVGTVLAGISWGALGWGISPLTDNPDNRLLIFLILMGIAAGGMATLAYRPLPYALFINLTLLPIFVSLHGASGNYPIAFSLALILYICFL